jgi:hypothetical protein
MVHGGQVAIAADGIDHVWLTRSSMFIQPGVCVLGGLGSL